MNNKANIQQYQYKGQPNQKWQVIEVEPGYYAIIAKHSGKCLDVAHSSMNNKANIQQDAYRGADNQKWQFIPISDTESKCFIATASYGTPYAKEIDILRAFRDNSLEPKPIGRMFVETYYKTSPPIANIIAKSEKLRASVRFLLVPVIKVLNR